MSFPKLPIVSGGGVSTSFFGPSVAAPQQFLNCTCQVPYVDRVLNTVAYREVTISFLDIDGFGSDLVAPLENLWAEVQNDFWINNYEDRDLISEIYMEDGLTRLTNVIDFTNMHSFEIEINDTGALIDRWWGVSNMAKFGYFNFLDGEYALMPMVWLNSTRNKILAPKAFMNGWQVFLQPGCSARVTGIGRLIPPKIAYSIPGSGSGLYPF
jgi:hypothetical protein